MSQLGEVMDALLTNLIQEVGDDTMCSKSLMPGDSVLAEYVGLENCGGMLWVRYTTAGPSVSFPAQGLTVDNCAYTLAVPIEIGILRPAPQATQPIGRSVALPTDEEHNRATHQQIDDMMTIRRAIQKSAQGIDESVLGSYQPIGPQEGVVGGYWMFTVSVD